MTNELHYNVKLSVNAVSLIAVDKAFKFTTWDQMCACAAAIVQLKVTMYQIHLFV